MALILDPFINGQRFSRSSVALEMAAIQIAAFKSIEFGDELTPGELFGSGAHMMGRTTGKVKLSMSAEIGAEEWYSLLMPALNTLAGGRGYGVGVFPTQLIYWEPVLMPSVGAMTIVADGCRVMKATDSVGDNEDPLMVKLEIHLMRLYRNGMQIAGENPF